MLKVNFKRTKSGVLYLAAAFLVLYALNYTQVLQRLQLNLLEWRGEQRWQLNSLWLPDYVATIQGLPIEGLDSDVSALTFDPDRKSLFGVTNQRPHIFELSLMGKLIRTIPLSGFNDPESIVYIGPGVYIIADERKQRLIKINLSDNTSEVKAERGEHLTLRMGTAGNKGFEGLAYDPVGERLFVAQERDPVRILEIHGFPTRSAQQPFALQVVSDDLRNEQLAVRDLSGLQFDTRYGHLLVLSDESRLLLELDPKGRPISSMSLRKGRHELAADIPQPEGVAMDTIGNLYIVSEPNLFYRFEKTADVSRR